MLRLVTRVQFLLHINLFKILNLRFDKSQSAELPSEFQFMSKTLNRVYSWHIMQENYLFQFLGLFILHAWNCALFLHATVEDSSINRWPKFTSELHNKKINDWSAEFHVTCPSFKSWHDQNNDSAPRLTTCVNGSQTRSR